MTDPDDIEEIPVHDLDDAPPEAEDRVSDEREREALLAATMAHAEARDARYRGAPVAPRPAAVWWKWLTSLGLVVVALLLLAAPPVWIAAPPRPSLGPDQVERGLLTALFLQAGEIEAFRAREGRLPYGLEELGAQAPGVRYVRSNARVFQLVAVLPHGFVLVWDSGDPPPVSAALARRWLGPGPAP